MNIREDRKSPPKHMNSYNESYNHQKSKIFFRQQKEYHDESSLEREKSIEPTQQSMQ